MLEFAFYDIGEYGLQPFYSLGTLKLIGLNININLGTPSIHNINFSINKSEEYYLYILLN